jgi:hypothetical protein
VNVTGETPNGFQPPVALRYGWTLSSPGDRRFRTDVGLVSLSGKTGKAAQKIFGIK